ncbi:MAG: nicotinate-nucleotide--dimethylbenzimidazole phosphoribosyltransferase [Xanthobacteraceae bacterium]|nr:nicotinate-nucleotide--dimethylbenzimidazole phosphoribosyltransferase [Xanthobacteraceae bacterium]
MTDAFPTPYLPDVAPLDPALEPALRARIDGKAKPPGSLGRIEDLAVQLGLIAYPAEPRVQDAALLVFAGDHGMTASGVSQYPSSVTAAMVATFLAGRASANAFAAATGARLRVIDAGVVADLPPHPGLIDAKVARGTADAAREPAMTPEQATTALTRGCAIARREIDAGADVVAIGEMGIGNTAAAALLAHRLAPAPLDDCIGPGAGQSDEGLKHKRAVLARAAARSDASAPLDVLAAFGGFEIAMMAGAVIGAAASRRPVVIDGFIAGAAALVAVRLTPAARDYCVFAHRSAERGHGRILAALGAAPLIDLGLRLGEGTGALLAVPLLRAAARLMTDVASLDDVLAGNLR